MITLTQGLTAVLVSCAGFTAGDISPIDALFLRLSRTPAMRMTKGYTFLNVKAVTVEVFLPDDHPQFEVVRRGFETDEDRKRVVSTVMALENLLIGVTFLRDVSLNKYVSITEDNIDEAVKAGIVSRDEYRSVWPAFLDEMRKRTDGSFRKGGQISYRVHADHVRVLSVDAEGEPEVDFLITGEDAVRLLEGVFFARGSDFRDGLIESALRRR